MFGNLLKASRIYLFACLSLFYLSIYLSSIFLSISKGESKVLQYVDNLTYNSISPDAFAEVTKVTYHTGM